MARLVWSVLCQKAVIDREDNSAHIQGTIEAIAVGAPPPDAPEGMQIRLQAPHSVFSLWTRSNLNEPETTRARIRLLCPDGEEYTASEIEINLEKQKNLRNHMRAQDFPFHGFGEYCYVVEERSPRARSWRTVASIPFEMLLADLPPRPDEH